MFYFILTFVAGLLIPFIARRFGKILPATTGRILFDLPHFPRNPKPHNPLQRRSFYKKWQKLCCYAICIGVIYTTLCWASIQYISPKTQPYNLLYIWIVLCAAETDRRYMILPDCLTIPLLLIGFLFAIQTPFITPLQSVLGSFFAYAVTTTSVFLLSFRKHTIFGAGDSKFAMALGAWLGMQGLNYSIFLSFFLFVIDTFLTQKRAGAYGPALGLAAIFSFFILYVK